MLSWKRKPEPARITPTVHTHPDVLPSETGPRVATSLGDVITSIGCLTGNVAVLATAVNERLAAGDLSAEQATALVNRLKNAHQDLETACMVVTRARGDITPPAAADHGHPHD